MARTRATKASTSKSKSVETTTTTTTTTTSTGPASTRLPPSSVETPPQVFVLPKATSSEARIVTILNPATFTPSRYLLCPEKGVHEFISVALSKSDKRSWLLAPNQSKDHDDDAEHDENKNENRNGYVLQTPDMMLATPIDPLFLILPALAGDGTNAAQEFMATSDYVARLTETSPHLAQVMTPTQLETMFARRIGAVSDSMDIGDEKMYALALPKLVKQLVAKARRMASRGLPPSMEDRFVKQALDVPVLSIANDDSTPCAQSQISSVLESQESTTSVTTVASVSTAATSVPPSEDADNLTAPKEITHFLRIRVALNFILSSYIVPRLRTTLEPLIADPAVSGQDFALLNRHLDRVASLRKEAQALRSISDNVSRKRAIEDDDEVAAAKAEKKRKKDEEDSKKKNMSVGLKKLAKADTSGMKKMSSFFTKAPTK